MFGRNVEKVAVPTGILTGYTFLPRHYADAFCVDLPDHNGSDMRLLAYHLFGRRESFPRYVVALLYLRDVLVKPLRLKGGADLKWTESPGEWIGFFQILYCTADEIILGDDDRHLDFRVSLLRQKKDSGTTLTLTTVVRFHNLLGRWYFAIIKPFHKLIVADMLEIAFWEKGRSVPIGR